MAKRKRLTPAQSDYLQSAAAAVPPGLETKSMAPLPGSGSAPIAQVAGEASASAALQTLADEVQSARDDGRMIQRLPLEAIDAGYLVRDRIAVDDDEMQGLMASIRARGQQTPLEVVALAPGRYGLISGWRRLTALGRLRDATGDARFATALALERRPETAAEAYVAMVEENEIRVGLSYYERARVAAKAVEQGVYETEKAALLALFATASRAKRSKIRSFLPIYHAADAHLRFAAAIPERLGLALAKALEAGPEVAARLRSALDPPAETAEDELARLTQCLVPEAPVSSRTPDLETVSEPVSGSEPASDTVPDPVSAPAIPPSARRRAGTGVERVQPQILASWTAQKLTLSGSGLTPALRDRILDLLADAAPKTPPET